MEHSLHFQKNFSFSANSQSHLPHTGEVRVWAWLLLICNWIKYLDFPKEAFILLLFNYLNFVFQAGQSLLTAWFQQACSYASSKCRWQKFISMKKKHIEYILWLWSDLGIRCAMRPVSQWRATRFWNYINLRQRYMPRGRGLLIIHHRAMFVQNKHKQAAYILLDG